jgi:prepilin-type N-terminal cleavage/methylation domain-containing protein
MESAHPMKAKFNLELLRSLRQRQNHSTNRSSGVTLVELLVVIAVICLYTVIALPSYIRARSRSEAGTSVSELTGLAKHCAMANASKLQEIVKINGVSVTCNGAAVTISGRPFMGPVDSVICLGTSAVTSVTVAYVVVSSSGSMSCSFS